jgi:hypothetical protein
MINLNPIISNLTRRILAQALQELPPEDILNQTVREVYQRVLNMPRFLLIPIVMLTIIFDGYGLSRNGRLFRRQNAVQQDQQIACWQNSPMSMCRDFIKLYQKTIIFVYYSLPQTTQALDQGTTT